jgi:hypothetical protein
MANECVIVTLVVTLMACYGAPPPAHPEVAESPLEPASTVPPRAATVVDAYLKDGIILPGSFDHSIYRRVYTEKLTDCSSRIVAASKEWANANALAILKSQIGTRRVLLHLGKSEDIHGFFEVIYRLDKDALHARVTFLFYDNRGVAIEPSNRLRTAQALNEQLPELILCRPSD